MEHRRERREHWEKEAIGWRQGEAVSFKIRLYMFLEFVSTFRAQAKVCSSQKVLSYGSFSFSVTMRSGIYSSSSEGGKWTGGEG